MESCSVISNTDIYKDVKTINNKITDTANYSQQHIDRIAQHYLSCEAETILKKQYPTEESINNRINIYEFIKNILKKKAPDSYIVLHGSTAICTYLSTSDIDISVHVPLSHAPKLIQSFYNLLQKYIKNNNYKISNLRLITADIPVIKCIINTIPVDITLNTETSVIAVYFWEEINKLFGHQDLFKRSCLLIQSLLTNELHIINSSECLLSTYSIMMMIFYICNMYVFTTIPKSRHKYITPYDVLCIFLEIFSEFDFKNYVLTLCGRVPKYYIQQMQNTIMMVRKKRDITTTTTNEPKLDLPTIDIRLSCNTTRWCTISLLYPTLFDQNLLYTKYKGCTIKPYIDSTVLQKLLYRSNCFNVRTTCTNTVSTSYKSENIINNSTNNTIQTNIYMNWDIRINKLPIQLKNVTILDPLVLVNNISRSLSDRNTNFVIQSIQNVYKTNKILLQICKKIFKSILCDNKNYLKDKEKRIYRVLRKYPTCIPIEEIILQRYIVPYTLEIEDSILYTLPKCNDDAIKIFLKMLCTIQKYTIDYVDTLCKDVNKLHEQRNKRQTNILLQKFTAINHQTMLVELQTHVRQNIKNDINKAQQQREQDLEEKSKKSIYNKKLIELKKKYIYTLRHANDTLKALQIMTQGSYNINYYEKKKKKSLNIPSQILMRKWQAFQERQQKWTQSILVYTSQLEILVIKIYE